VSNFFYNLSRLNFSSVIDILLVALVFYWILTLLQGTQAEQLLRGLLILSVLAAIAASVFKTLTAFSWLIDKALPALLVAIPIVFQPELRRGLERVGRTSKIFMTPHANTLIDQAIEAVGKAASAMARVKHGALIVFERNTHLEDYIESGVRLEALVTTDLLRTIFMPGTTLHDGAVIIRDNRIVAASVILPLGQAVGVAPIQSLGTRHLAALGISEMTDAVVVVISEETGVISIANNGQLVRGLDQSSLEQMLRALYTPGPNIGPVWQRVLRKLLSTLGVVKPSETISQVRSPSE
jgi:diadenylate cyclase